MNFENDYQKGIHALEDLYSLGGSSIAPVVNRAYYHFFNLRTKIANSSLENMPQIKSFLSRSVMEMIRDYLSFNSGYLKINFQVDYDLYSLEQWNRLLEVLPSMLAIVNSFDYKENLLVLFGQNGVEVVGDVEIGEGVEALRPDIYRNFKTIIKNNSLLTFSLSSKGTRQHMSLFLDISFALDRIYSIDMRDEYADLVLGLPNNFGDYVTSEKLAADHDVLEITDHLELIRYSAIPDQIDPEREVLHFSFLFRPVSLIIPKRGKLLPIETLRPGEGTGSGKKIEKSKNAGFYYLDFFSIMSR